MPARTFGQYTRYVVLMDQPFYAISWLVQNMIERGVVPNQSVPDVSFILGFTSNVNRLILLPGGVVAQEFLPPRVYRNLITLGGALLSPQLPETFAPCLLNSVAVPPSLIRIDSTIAQP